MCCRAVAMSLAAAAIGFAAAQFAERRDAAFPRAASAAACSILTGTVRSVEQFPERETHWTGSGADRRWRRTTALGPRSVEKGRLAGGSLHQATRSAARAGPPSDAARPIPAPGTSSAMPGSADRVAPDTRWVRWSVMAEAPPKGPLRLVQRLRETIVQHISAVVPGAAGAICGHSAHRDHDRHSAARPRGFPRLGAGASAGGRRDCISASSWAGRWHSRAWRLRRPSMPVCTGRPRNWPLLAALAAGGSYMVLTGMHVPIVRRFRHGVSLHRCRARRAKGDFAPRAWRWRPWF